MASKNARFEARRMRVVKDFTWVSSHFHKNPDSCPSCCFPLPPGKPRSKAIEKPIKKPRKPKLVLKKFTVNQHSEEIGGFDYEIIEIGAFECVEKFTVRRSQSAL